MTPIILLITLTIANSLFHVSLLCAEYPQNYSQAATCIYVHRKQTMIEELQAMEANKTWLMLPYLLTEKALVTNGSIRSTIKQMAP